MVINLTAILRKIAISEVTSNLVFKSSNFVELRLLISIKEAFWVRKIEHGEATFIYSIS
jgi:hypothetical protein